MDRSTRATLAALVCAVGAGVFFALAVYPFGYGPVESGLVAGAFVAVALFETVLDDASF